MECEPVAFNAVRKGMFSQAVKQLSEKEGMADRLKAENEIL